MNKRDARRLGFDTGYGIAEAQIAEAPKGKPCEEVASEASETESEHYRQFSPFEFTAQEFNESRDPDGVWAAYDDGVYKGIWKKLREAGCRGGRKRLPEPRARVPKGTQLQLFSGCGCGKRRRSRRRH